MFVVFKCQVYLMLVVFIILNICFIGVFCIFIYFVCFMCLYVLYISIFSIFSISCVFCMSFVFVYFVYFGYFYILSFLIFEYPFYCRLGVLNLPSFIQVYSCFLSVFFWGGGCPSFYLFPFLFHHKIPKLF